MSDCNSPLLLLIPDAISMAFLAKSPDYILEWIATFLQRNLSPLFHLWQINLGYTQSFPVRERQSRTFVWISGPKGRRFKSCHLDHKSLEFRLNLPTFSFLLCCIYRLILLDMPLKSAIRSSDTISQEEAVTAEKCLLYVALTRAKKSVKISGYGKSSSLLPA